MPKSRTRSNAVRQIHAVISTAVFLAILAIPQPLAAQQESTSGVDLLAEIASTIQRTVPPEPSDQTPLTLLSTLPSTLLSNSEGMESVQELTVRCDRGKSLQKALQTNAKELVINIHGICEEDVEIRRDRVTLRGEDPDRDGIRARSAEASDQQRALNIRDAEFVKLENLQIAGSAAIGLNIVNSTGVELSNVLVTGNATTGVMLHSSWAKINGTRIIDSRRSGLFAVAGSDVECNGCEIIAADDVGGFSVITGGGSYTVLRESTLTGTSGMIAYGASHLFATRTQVSAETNRFAVVAVDGSTASAAGNSNIEGRIGISEHSVFTMNDSTQEGDQIRNFIDDASLLTLRRSSLTGDSFVTVFSEALFTDSTFEVLQCRSGGRVICEENGVETEGCGVCGLP